MAVNLSPVGGVAAQFFDNSGQVLTGGKLYTYAAGTTTPAVTYTSSNGITAHSNPIVLNAAGRVPDSGEIWLTDGISYKFALKDSNDVQIATYDNINGINSNFIAYTSQSETQTATQGQTVFTLTTIQYQPATDNLAVFVNGSKQVLSVNYQETSSTVITFIDGLNVGDIVEFNTASPVSSTSTTAANVSYNEGDTFAVTRTVESKLQEMVSVKDFGATGNGVTDDTTAIQNAIAAVGDGGQVFFPAGTYVTSSTINGSNVTLCGVGEASVIKPTVAVTNAILLNSSSDGATGFAYQSQIKDLFLEGQNTVGATGILLGTTVTTANYLINNVTINRFASSGGKGIDIRESVYAKIENCEIASCQKGIYINGTGTNPTTTVVENCYIRANAEEGVLIENAWQATFRNCVFEANRSEGFKCKPEITIGNGILISLEDCWFEDNQYAQPSRTTLYSCVLDSSNTNVSLSASLRNIFFSITALTEKALDLNKVSSGVTLDLIENRNIPNSIRILDASSVVTVVSYPENYDWKSTLLVATGAIVKYLPQAYEIWLGWIPTITGFGSMTFTVVNLPKAKYKVNGKTCTVQLDFEGTTAGTASSAFKITLPSGVVPTDTKGFSTALAEDAGVYSIGYVQTGSTDGLYAGKLNSTNYGIGTSMGARFTFTFEIV